MGQGKFEEFNVKLGISYIRTMFIFFIKVNAAVAGVSLHLICL